jgi:L-threonylcarbamoyladenylate synthase
LFAGLRYFDDKKDVQTILVAALPQLDVNGAYNNRLGKAAGGHWISELLNN